ncbi:hypothetical protein J2S89_002733 [Arthrobacter bambusae]|nr:hypothetical protein [Arthrobacter bambusae]MDQ0099259.1 hypothetical protein [Arthrobacter bambusae]
MQETRDSKVRQSSALKDLAELKQPQLGFESSALDAGGDPAHSGIEVRLVFDMGWAPGGQFKACPICELTRIFPRSLEAQSIPQGHM